MPGRGEHGRLSSEVGTAIHNRRLIEIKRQLQLTAKGRRAVTHWLRQPAGAPQFYAESLVKLFFAAQAGDLQATKRIVQGDRDAFAERLSYFEALLPFLASDPASKYPAMTLDFGIRLHRTILEWCDETTAKLDREMAQG